MTTLTIEIPDNVTEDVVKYLKEKAVVIKDTPFKTIDELTADDYRNNFKERAKMTRAVALRYL